jgi:hypothetical protein
MVTKIRYSADKGNSFKEIILPSVTDLEILSDNQRIV